MSEVYCEAPFNYINDAAAPEDERVSAVVRTIQNGRSAGLPGWQECGFELMSHHSEVSNWQDDNEIVERHYDEIRQLAKLLTGCDHALVGSHIKRGPEQRKIHADYGPIAFVHSDFAESYGDLMRRYYSADTTEARLGLAKSGATVEDVKRSRKLMILQFWRNLDAPKMDTPLAFCDARTVSKSELRPFLVQDYAGGGFDFDTLGVAPADAHAWYVFPEMNIDEVVVFRTYDSDLIDSDDPYWTPHSAFSDPAVKPGHPSRVSIELRATCIFK